MPLIHQFNCSTNIQQYNCVAKKCNNTIYVLIIQQYNSSKNNATLQFQLHNIIVVYILFHHRLTISVCTVKIDLDVLESFYNMRLLYDGCGRYITSYPHLMRRFGVCPSKDNSFSSYYLQDWSSGGISPSAMLPIGSPCVDLYLAIYVCCRYARWTCRGRRSPHAVLGPQRSPTRKQRVILCHKNITRVRRVHGVRNRQLVL